MQPEPKEYEERLASVLIGRVFQDRQRLIAVTCIPVTEISHECGKFTKQRVCRRWLHIVRLNGGRTDEESQDHRRGSKHPAERVVSHLFFLS
jgi:hypothetical protein